VILGYACCPFCSNSVLVQRCDFIRHDPLRGNPALVPVCEFIRHACGRLCGIGALGAISFALPVSLLAAILCGFHHATSFAMPVAFYEALQRWLHNAIIGYACCLFCGNSCLSPNAISFAMTLSASIQRLFPYAISFAMPVAFSAAMERSMRFHSLCLLPFLRQSCAGLRILARQSSDCSRMQIHSPCLLPSLRRWGAQCDFIRFACCPLGGNPVRVLQCTFVCYTCCTLCGNKALVPQCDYWLCLLPFLWQFMLVPQWDFIRHDPLRVNPALCFRLRFHSPCLLPSLRQSCAGLRIYWLFLHRFARPLTLHFFAACRAAQSGPYRGLPILLQVCLP